jgi:hypothetical protein
VRCFKKIFFLSLLAITGCQTTNTSVSEKVDVPILLKEEKGKRGIFVSVSSDVHAAGSEKGRISLTIINYLRERIFLQVLDKPLPYWVRLRDSNGDLIASAGSSVGGSSHDDRSFKLLEPSINKIGDNLKACCDPGVATFNCVLEGEGDMDLKEWIGGEVEISVPIHGYFGKNGASFFEFAKVSVKIIKGPSETNDKK